MKDSLYEQIKQKEHCIRFHTPGHSGSSPSKEYAELYANAKFDITELPYSDNLLNSTSCLQRLQERLAQVYHYQHSYIFTSGATSAIFCAIFSRATFGDNFLVMGGAHKSIYNALRLAHCKVWQTPYKLDIDYILNEIKDKKITTVIVTTPDYRGQCIPLTFFEELKKRHPDICLLIDASHGAHFAFSSKFDKEIPKGADLVIHSLHKTLPVFTGGAVLHSTSKYADKIDYYRSTLHSTSPSYPIMLSIECAINYYEREGEQIYQDIFDGVRRFSQAIPKEYQVVDNTDFSRLVLSCKGYDCVDVYNALALRGIYAEAASSEAIIFILTQNNIWALDILKDALFAIIPTLVAKKVDKNPSFEYKDSFLMEFCKDFKLVSPKDCLGEVAYSEIGLYPPGTPFLFSGQKITKAHVNFILEHATQLFGLVKGKVCVVK